MPIYKEMDLQVPPSKIARFADSSTSMGQASCLTMERNRSGSGSGSPPIGLGLALGPGGSSDHHRPIPTTAASGSGSATAKVSYGFTILQMQELQLQTLIYKHIEAGYSVPYNLLLPIWKSVSGSNMYQLYPSFMRGSQMQLEYRNGVNPEPGRCRRTDGKKWRCSKEALPDQKYCERHMHRGRQRSRKLMEAAQMNSNACASTNLSICLPASVSSTASTHNSPTSAFYSNIDKN